jgi:hypothetical protein
MPEASQERLVKDTRRVLENPFWIPDLKTMECYSRLHDDHDGTYNGSINVTISEDGDVWFRIIGERNSDSLRFRMSLGGGMSPRVRNALMILALAIKLDNEKNPQKKS